MSQKHEPELYQITYSNMQTWNMITWDFISSIRKNMINEDIYNNHS